MIDTVVWSLGPGYNSYSFKYPENMDWWENHLDLVKVVSPPLTTYHITQNPGGTWQGQWCDWEGKVTVDKRSRGKAILALAYVEAKARRHRGYIFGADGAIVCLEKKDSKIYWHFTPKGIKVSTSHPLGGEKCPQCGFEL